MGGLHPWDKGPALATARVCLRPQEQVHTLSLAFTALGPGLLTSAALPPRGPAHPKALLLPGPAVWDEQHSTLGMPPALVHLHPPGTGRGKGGKQENTNSAPAVEAQCHRPSVTPLLNEGENDTNTQVCHPRPSTERTPVRC